MENTAVPQYQDLWPGIVDNLQEYGYFQILHPVVFQTGGVKEFLRDARLRWLSEDYGQGNVLEVQKSAGLFEPDGVPS